MDCKNLVNELEYLINPIFYEKIILNKKEDDDKNLKNEIKFYKKRIIQLTKDLSKGVIIQDSLSKVFLEYSKCCITYLKDLDKKDILQSEYENLNINKDLDIELKINNSEDELNNKLINPNYINNKNDIAKLLNIKKLENNLEDSLIIPQQKNLDLKDESLKNKGIKNKKNKKKKKDNIT